MSNKNVVLVTGGAGFLGQHVVRLLQTEADDVTEIRVLDIVPYVNKLEHKERLEVTSFTGSITDYNHVVEACKGVDSVMHIASIVDIRLFPDEQRSYNVNVIGTETVVNACKATGVKRLIYCSTIDVAMTKASIYDGNEDNTKPTEDHENMFPVYGPTKVKAEKLVLNENGTTLRTMSLRPPGMYGDLSYRFNALLETAQPLGYYFRMKTNGVTVYAYVGNIAWAFICAEKTLAKEDKNARIASGNAYFVGDETPHTDMYGLLDPMFQGAGARPFPIAIPVWLIICFMYMLYVILNPVRLLFNVNVENGLPAFRSLTKTFLFSHTKAKNMLGYKPLFSVDESYQRTTKYYKRMFEGKHN